MISARTRPLVRLYLSKRELRLRRRAAAPGASPAADSVPAGEPAPAGDCAASVEPLAGGSTCASAAWMLCRGSVINQRSRVRGIARRPLQTWATGLRLLQGLH